MRKKIDTNSNKSKEDKKLEILVDDHNVTIYKTLIHKRTDQ